jgi:phage shock protein C
VEVVIMTVAEELERLQGLRERGSLTDQEYAQAKARVLGAAAAHPGFLHRLSLSATDRVIGGVCGGLGAHTGLPSWAWRVIFCVSVLYAGIGLLFYILLWIFIPAQPPATPAP